MGDFYDLTAGDRKVDDPGDSYRRADNMAMTRLHTRSGGSNRFWEKKKRLQTVGAALCLW